MLQRWEDFLSYLQHQSLLVCFSDAFNCDAANVLYVVL